MKISEDQIKKKQMAGRTQDKTPVLYVETKGGLHLFFTKKDGQMISLAAAPHRAIAQWMAEKKEKVEWDKDFLYKREQTEADLKKNERDLFSKLRAILWGKQLVNIDDNKDHFLVYNGKRNDYTFLRKGELIDNIKKDPANKYNIIRELSLDSLAIVACLHKDFKDLA